MTLWLDVTAVVTVADVSVTSPPNTNTGPTATWARAPLESAATETWEAPTVSARPGIPSEVMDVPDKSRGRRRRRAWWSIRGARPPG